MEYSKEIKKKAVSYANAVAGGNITLFLQFENWLRQKLIEKTNLFGDDR